MPFMFFRSCSSSTDHLAARRRVPASTAVFSNDTVTCGMFEVSSNWERRAATPESSTSCVNEPAGPPESLSLEVPVKVVFK